MPIELFKAVQLVVMLGFAVLISDSRRREGAEPLVPTAAVLLLRLIYPIPFVVYLVVVVRLPEVAARDLLALALTSTGAFLVARARVDIGPSYTWTGYRSARPELVTRGVYGVIRHPIYLGIWLFMAGGTISVLGRVSLGVHVVAALALVYIGVFLGVAAVRETQFLASFFGEDFERYRRRVGVVLPTISRQ